LYDIVQERTSRACAAHIPQRRRLRLIDVACHAHRPWLPLPHIPCGKPIMQRIGSLGWGLGDGSCSSDGLNYVCRKAHCACRTVQCQSRSDINTATPVQCPLTLTPVLALQHSIKKMTHCEVIFTVIDNLCGCLSFKLVMMTVMPYDPSHEEVYNAFITKT